MLHALVLRIVGIVTGVLVMGVPAAPGTADGLDSLFCPTVPAEALDSMAVPTAAPGNATTVRVSVGSAVLVELDGSGRPIAVATNGGAAPGCLGTTWLVWSPSTSTSSPASLDVIDNVHRRVAASEDWSTRSFHLLGNIAG